VSLFRNAGIAVLMICGVFVAADVLAAEPEAAASPLQEILVTAQKITENVQKVPISLTVISGVTLAEQGARDFTDVLSEVPNLAFQFGTAGAGGMGLSSSRGISIRGVSGTNTTSVYIDDTPVPVSIDPHLLDIDHIEVLKGPQGTLYGQASMGGTVKIVTERPSADSFAGNVVVDGHELDGGGFGTFDSTKVNIPLGTNLAVRLGGFYSYDPGFLTRTYNDPSAINGKFVTGPPQVVNHVGANTSYGGTASLRFEPEDSSGLVIEPTIMGESTHSNGFLATDNSTSNYVQRRALNVPEDWTDTFYLTSLNISINTAIGKLVSSTSDFYRDSQDQEDGSDVTQQLFNLKPVLPVVGLTHLYDERFTEELRLESQIGNNLQTTVGLYFNDAVSTYDELIQSPGTPIPGNIPGANAAGGGSLGTDIGYLSHQPGRSTEKAIYISAAYSLTSHLKLSAGARESYLYRENENTTYGFYNGGFGYSDVIYRTKATTPRISAQYQLTDDHMVYATAAKGFRPGGEETVPSICAADLAAIGRVPGQFAFDSDSLWNYEMGAKTKWFNGRMTANIAAYDMEWKGIQQLIRLPICGFQINVNGAAARSRGSEVEVSLAPVEGLTLGVSAGYEEAKITSVAPNSGSLFVGQPLNGVPKWNGTANAKYEHATNSLGRAFFRVDYTHVGDSLTLNNSTVFGRIRPAYDLVDLRVGTVMKKLEISIYGKNITNSHPNLGDEVAEVVETIGRPRYIIGPPTSVGVEVRKDF
jgi:outer membrane receptor protein involved in Fe transport